MRVQWEYLALVLGLWLAAGAAIGQDVPRDRSAVEPTRDSGSAQPEDARFLARPRDRIGPAIGPGEIGPIGPIGPEIDTGVYQPADFTIGGYTTTEVGMRWWNRGAPQTEVFRSINGGAWSIINTFAPLPTNAYIDYRDLQAAANTENCYRVSVSDGTNPYSALSTPVRCVITRDGRNLLVHRLQLRLRVANVANAGTDDPLEVRLQSPSWLVPAVTNWRPAGNSTWVDSTANDFERNSNLTYDLMLTNVSEVSDVTQITLAKPGSDQLCVASLELLANGLLAFARTYGDTASSCAWMGGGNVLSVDFPDLRNSTSWNQLGTVTFSGFNGAAMRSIIQAQFGHALHGMGELRNGSAITTTRANESRLNVFVPIRVYDVPVLGDVDSDVRFDLVLTTAGQLSIENVDADSSDVLGYFLPVVGWKILHETSQRIESTLGAMRPSGGASSPIPGTHPCFTQDGGVGVCFDS